MGKRELDALLNLSSWCLVMVQRLFLAMPQGCLRFVIVVFPDRALLLFLLQICFSLSPPVKYFYRPFQGRSFVISVLFLFCFRARLFIGALW